MNREWCSRENLTSKRLERWYFMRRINRPNDVPTFDLEHLSGDDALAVHAMRSTHKKPDYMWDEHRLKKHIAWLRQCMRQGMTDDEYTGWSQREMNL